MRETIYTMPDFQEPRAQTEESKAKAEKEMKAKTEKELKADDKFSFSWGLKRGVGRVNKNTQFYESFTYDGIEYFLYDCIYMYRSGESKPDIGKLINIWETESHKKLVKVVWFFRPSEIAYWMKDVKPLEKEIFIACSEGTGLCNINRLEAVSGKCNVVCISKHRKNPRPTEKELRSAEYIFYRTFDVSCCKISDAFPVSICGIEVEHFFNRTRNQSSITYAKPEVNLKGKPTIISMKHGNCMGAKVEDLESFPSSNVFDSRPLKKRKVQGSLAEDPRYDRWNDSRPRVRGDRENVSSVRLEKKLRIPADKGADQDWCMSKKVKSKFMEVAMRPEQVSTTWFKQSWEERLHEAEDRGSLVLLENLDPSYTSAEVEDIVWHSFEEKVKAMIISCSSLSNPNYGQAFVIFKTKEAAESVISQLTKGCLLLGDGRPILGRRGFLTKSDGACTLAGYLSIDAEKLKRKFKERRNAVSTAHYSQPNNIEYELGFEWFKLQTESDLQWTMLHEKQQGEVEALRKQMKILQQVKENLEMDL